MRTFLSTAVSAAVSIMLAGCAVPTKYTWGNYDRSLYGYYKDTTKSAEHMAELQSIVRSAEETRAKVAPGIHAEYGYFLMQQGKPNEAASQFEKEKAAWPESAQLMESMIKIASAQANKPVASRE
jgi:hypothetical protein